MPLLSTFESPYYRRPATLCGPLDEGAKNYFNDLLNKNLSKSQDLKKSIFDTLENCIFGESSFLYNEYDPEDFYNYLKDSYAGTINEPLVSEGIRLFKIQLSRKKQAQKAAEDAAAQAAAYAAAKSAQIEPAAAVEEVEIPEGLDVSDIIAIQEIAAAQNIEQAAQIARENAEQVAEAYANGQATAEQVQAAAQVAEAIEAENTKKTIINKVLPLTLAAGLFIFLMKRNK